MTYTSTVAYSVDSFGCSLREFRRLSVTSTTETLSSSFGIEQIDFSQTNFCQLQVYSVTPRVVTIVPLVSGLWDKLVHQITGTATITWIFSVRTCINIGLTKVSILPFQVITFQLSRNHLQSIINDVMIETWVTAFPRLSVSPTRFWIFQRQTVSHTIVLYIVCRWVEHDTVTIRHISRLV